MALNAKHRAFVNEYIKSRNITKAGLAAGFSAKTAAQQGSRLFKNVEVKAAIDKALARVTEKAELTAAAVLAELQKLAFVDITKAFNDDGTVKTFSEMPDDVRAALQAFEIDELFAGRGANKRKIGLTKKLKFGGKVESLKMLAQHLKLLTEVHEHTGKDGGPVVVMTLPSNGSEAPKEDGNDGQ